MQLISTRNTYAPKKTLGVIGLATMNGPSTRQILRIRNRIFLKFSCTLSSIMEVMRSAATERMHSPVPTNAHKPFAGIRPDRSPTAAENRAMIPSVPAQ